MARYSTLIVHTDQGIPIQANGKHGVQSVADMIDDARRYWQGMRDQADLILAALDSRDPNRVHVEISTGPYTRVHSTIGACAKDFDPDEDAA